MSLPHSDFDKITVRWLSHLLGLLSHVLTLGWLLRCNVHIYVALATDHYPGLASNTIGLSSPVASLNDHPVIDLQARLLTTATVIISFWMFLQLAGRFTTTIDHAVLGFVLLNAGYALADPMWMGLNRLLQ